MTNDRTKDLEEALWEIFREQKKIMESLDFSSSKFEALRDMRDTLSEIQRLRRPIN